MLAVILARGLGTRMRRDAGDAPLTEQQRRAADLGVKSLMPVGRPFLDYVIGGLADAGVTRVCLVVAPDHDAIREHYERALRPERVRITFAVQDEPRGTADAVLAAEPYVERATFLALNGDNYYPVDAYRQLLACEGPALAGFDRDALVQESNIDVERVRQYALLRVSRDGYLEDIVEKPDDPTAALFGARALVSMNLWSFTPRIFEACRRVAPSSRGELELPAAVRVATRELGERFRVVPVSRGVLDLSNRRDVAIVTDRLRGVEVSL